MKVVGAEELLDELPAFQVRVLGQLKARSGILEGVVTDGDWHGDGMGQAAQDPQTPVGPVVILVPPELVW